MASQARTLRWVWILSLVVGLTFVITGSSKVLGIEPSPSNFARWGFTPAFRCFIGLAEVLGGIGLLVRPVAQLAAVGLIVTMLGAVRTGVIFHEAMHVALPLVLIVLLAALLYGRRRELARA